MKKKRIDKRHWGYVELGLSVSSGQTSLEEVMLGTTERAIRLAYRQKLISAMKKKRRGGKREGLKFGHTLDSKSPQIPN